MNQRGLAGGLALSALACGATSCASSRSSGAREVSADQMEADAATDTDAAFSRNDGSSDVGSADATPPVIFSACSNAGAGQIGRPFTIPAVREWAKRSGTFTFGRTSRLLLEPTSAGRLAATGRIFAEDLKALSGSAIPVLPGADAKAGDVALSLQATDAALGDEGYCLDVSDRIVIGARTDAGVFYGTRTVLQLLKQSSSIPAGQARDWPDYPYRELMVDVARKFYSLPWLQKQIREMAYLKLNHLHLGLADDGIDGAFRLESVSHPELVSKEHYSKTDIQGLVAFASDFHVMIVPRMNMPGHAGWVVARHPELQLTRPDGQTLTPRLKNLDLSKGETYAFARDILVEYVPLFPGPHWHLGADEYLWRNEDYSKYPQLLSYATSQYAASAVGADVLLGFINWADDLVKPMGKTLRIWNDAIKQAGTLAPRAVMAKTDVLIDYWYRDQYEDSSGGSAQSFIDAGYSLVNSNGDYLYYVLGSAWKPNDTDLYEKWRPHLFEGADNKIAVRDPRNYGAQFCIWDGGAETEDQVAAGTRAPLRSMSQNLWGTEHIASKFPEFLVMLNRIGRSPGVTYPGE